MTSELHSLVQKSCRVCGAAIGQTTFQSAAKFDLQEALLNCLKIDIRNDSVSVLRTISILLRNQAITQ